MSAKTLQRHYARLLRQWPEDKLRPIRFHEALRRRLLKTLLPHESPVEANGAQVTPVPPTRAKDEEAQVNALYSLLENKYSRHYPTSDRMMRPASRPTYYEDLAAELERAPKRSWLENQMLRWSKLVRLS